MSSETARFTLADGETLQIDDDDLRRIYEALWQLASEPGAVSTAALVIEAARMHPLLRGSVALTSQQSEVLRQVVARLRAST